MMPEGANRWQAAGGESSAATVESDDERSPGTKLFCWVLKFLLFLVLKFLVLKTGSGRGEGAEEGCGEVGECIEEALTAAMDILLRRTRLFTTRKPAEEDSSGSANKSVMPAAVAAVAAEAVPLVLPDTSVPSWLNKSSTRLTRRTVNSAALPSFESGVAGMDALSDVDALDISFGRPRAGTAGGSVKALDEPGFAGESEGCDLAS